MNRLLRTLQDKNQLTLGSLRRLYRGLAVRSHPDSPQGSETLFVRLQEEYDEALKCLLSRDADLATRRRRVVNAREQFLRMLYSYAVVYGGKDWRRYLSRLIELGFEYNDGVGRLFAEYQETVVPALHKRDYLTYLHEAHRIMLSSISTLAWVFEHGSRFDRRLLQSYLDDLRARGKKLEGKAGRLLSDMSRFLEKEAEGPAVSLVTIGRMERRRH